SALKSSRTIQRLRIAHHRSRPCGSQKWCNENHIKSKTRKLGEVFDRCACGVLHDGLDRALGGSLRNVILAHGKSLAVAGHNAPEVRLGLRLALNDLKLHGGAP